MFTDRFIKLPIEMYDRKEAELTGNDNSTTFEAYMMINPMEILSYRPMFDDDQNQEDKTVVDFKGGNSDIIVLMPIHEFENLLNHHFK